jgi:hypothetical protein
MDEFYDRNPDNHALIVIDEPNELDDWYTLECQVCGALFTALYEGDTPIRSPFATFEGYSA